MGHIKGNACKHAPQLTMTNTYSYRYKYYQSKTIQQHMTRAKTNTKHKAYKDINSNQWNKKQQSANQNGTDLAIWRISNGIEFHRKGELMKNEHWWKMMMQLGMGSGMIVSKLEVRIKWNGDFFYDGVGKKFSCIPLENHRINRPLCGYTSTSFSFYRPFAAHFYCLFFCTLFIAFFCTHFSLISMAWLLEMYMEVHFR